MTPNNMRTEWPHVDRQSQRARGNPVRINEGSPEDYREPLRGPLAEASQRTVFHALAELEIRSREHAASKTYLA